MALAGVRNRMGQRGGNIMAFKCSQSSDSNGVQSVRVCDRSDWCFMR